MRSDLGICPNCLELCFAEWTIVATPKMILASYASHTSRSAHAAQATRHLLHHLSLSRLQHLFALRIIRVKLNSLLVVLDGLLQISSSLLRHGLPLISFRPVRLNLNALLSVA